MATHTSTGEREGKAHNVRQSSENDLIILMGATGSGKSTFLNRLVGKTVAPVGHGYESTTRDMQSIVVEMDRRTCTIVDSPGFDDTDQDENSDYNILDKITRWLQITYDLGQRVTGIIYMRDITEARMKGSSMQNLVMFRELCGTETLKNILFVTTKWDVANKDPTQQEMAAARQEQLQTKFLRNELSLGARLVKHDGTVQSANEILRELLGRPAVLLDIQKELCVDKIALKETSAGKTLNAKLEKEQQRLEAQYAAGLKAASDERSEMVRTMLQESSARFKEQLERVNAQKKSLEEGEVLRAGRIEELERKLETASKGQGQDSNNFLTNLLSGVLPAAVYAYNAYSDAQTTQQLKLATMFAALEMDSDSDSELELY